MSKRSAAIQASQPQTQSAPRWIPAYASLNTILLAFFITISINMGSHRELGYMGPGLGAFREAFTSSGFPAILTGAKRIVNLLTWGGKYIPEESSRAGERADAQAYSEAVPDAQPYDERLIEPYEHDLKETLMSLSKANQDVVLPIPVRSYKRMDPEAQERLAVAARLIRQTERSVTICATLPATDSSPEEAWEKATAWALQVGRHLCRHEKLNPDRVTAVGRVLDAAASSKDAKEREPALSLIIRPAPKGRPGTGADFEEILNLRQRTRTQYRLVP